MLPNKILQRTIYMQIMPISKFMKVSRLFKYSIFNISKKSVRYVYKE